MVDRRAFLGLTVAVPVVVCSQSSYKCSVSENRAPRDTDDSYYDEWLDDYNKDEMHLDIPQDE